MSMGEFVSTLQQVWDFLIDVLNQVFSLFTSSPIFIAVFVLWILDRVFHIFDLIKG